jgi:hypothetical protein|nr:hypothetical protein [Rhodospirillales bacterium]
MKKISFIFFLSVFSLSLFISTVSAKSSTKTLCHEALMEVTGEAMGIGSTNTVKLKRWINKRYPKNIRLKKFLKQQWLPRLKSNRDFTPNTLSIEQDKHIKACVAFIG